MDRYMYGLCLGLKGCYLLGYIDLGRDPLFLRLLAEHAP